MIISFWTNRSGSGQDASRGPDPYQGPPGQILLAERSQNRLGFVFSLSHVRAGTRFKPRPCVRIKRAFIFLFISLLSLFSISLFFYLKIVWGFFSVSVFSVPLFALSLFSLFYLSLCFLRHSVFFVSLLSLSSCLFCLPVSPFFLFASSLCFLCLRLPVFPVSLSRSLNLSLISSKTN